MQPGNALQNQPNTNSTNPGYNGGMNTTMPTSPYPNSAMPNASNPSPANPNLGAGGNNFNSGSQPGQSQFDMNSNAQDRQQLRNDRQELRQDRQAARNEGDRSRFLNYNGEWWYWMPGNYWMYYRDNNWNRYEPESFQPYRYSTGYRGDLQNSGVYYDESGRQYRRDYSPLRRALRNAEENGGPQVSVTTPQANVNTGGAAAGTSPKVGVEIGGAAGGNR
jgi:hypothetical protein